MENTLLEKAISKGYEPPYINLIKNWHKLPPKNKIIYLSGIQNWLMWEKHMYIEIHVDKTSSPKFAYSIYKFFWNDDWERITDFEYSDLYRTYEEALEEGLKKVLELI